VLVPEILIAGAEQAVLYASLTLSGNGQLTPRVAGRRVAAPGALLARLVPRRNTAATRQYIAEHEVASARMRGLLGSTTIVDDRGAQYALRGGGSSGKRGAPDRSVHLRVDPVPVREAEWIELRGQDGATARLLPSPRAVARIGQPGPVRVAAARRAVMPGGVPRVGGPRFYRDIGVALPAVDGVSIRLDTLISLPGSWLLYLCARPQWWNHGPAGRLAEDPFSVRGEDDRGGSYLGSYARNTLVLTPEETARESGGGRVELALEFLPRLDPLARAIKLTFQGADEEITVDLEIGTT
jgi:hypothetical protein